MNKKTIEPGLLQVFRWYAILRLGFLILLALAARREVIRTEATLGIDPNIATLLVGVEMAFLFGYLLWPWLERKLGRYYLPLALAFAIGGLLVEQHVLSPLSGLFQPIPFMFVLLILTAWQYSYRAVVAFTLAAAVFEITLIFIFPQPMLFEFLPERLNQMITYGGLISRTLSFLVLGYVVTRLMKSQREQRKALTQANQKLVQHAAALEQLTISRERNRISRELHDTLAHTLSALAVQLDAVVTVWESIPDRAREMLDQMLHTTRSGLDETRRALRALRAEPLEELGLALAVRTLAEDFAARYAMSLILDIPDQLDNLNLEVEQCYYRVAQETFENIGWHANAAQVNVKLDKTNHTLELIIQDDGQGFDPEKEAAVQQYGLLGMHERAEIIGADLHVESRPGAGATIRLLWENGR